MSTPNLTRIAEADTGRWFSNCFSHARWTPASTASILTGTYLSSHRVGYDDTTDVLTLPKELSTVPQLLGELGYRTVCFSGNSYLSSATELDRGFDRFERINKSDFLSLQGLYTLTDYFWNIRQTGAKMSLNPTRHKDCLPERYQTLALRRSVQNGLENERPFFAYMHLNNPHHPYRPPLAILEKLLEEKGSDLDPTDIYKASDKFGNNVWELIANPAEFDTEWRQKVLAAYEGEIRYADYLIGRVFDDVQSRDDTIVVVTGDHGELFGEGGVFGHNLLLHDKLLHVPLVIYGLDSLNVPSDGLVQHIDVMEMILSEVGADTSQFQGYHLNTNSRDFVIAERGPRHSDLQKLQELNPDANIQKFHGSGVSCIRSYNWKYKQSNDRCELFCLPDETTNQLSKFPEKESELAEVLDTLLPSKVFKSSAQAQFDAEMEEHLRDMGYID